MARDQKKARKEGRVILFLDESVFRLVPSVGKTYGPKGETPKIEETISRQRLPAISAISEDGKLYFGLVEETTIDSANVIEFLNKLREQIDEKMTIIWDGAPVHRSNKIKKFLEEGGAEQIHLERLPAYAPELNPDEGVWSYLKSVELKNVCCFDLQELKERILDAVKRLKEKVEVCKGIANSAKISVGL